MTQQQVLKILGQTIALKRKSLGLSQEKLADQVDVHRTYIGFIEQGKRNPTILTLSKIAKALNVPLTDLVKDISK